MNIHAAISVEVGAIDGAAGAAVGAVVGWTGGAVCAAIDAAVGAINRFAVHDFRVAILFLELHRIYKKIRIFLSFGLSIDQTHLML